MRSGISSARDSVDWVVVMTVRTHLSAALWGVHPTAEAPPQTQILPSKNRTSRMTRIKPSPPLGAYPQLRLCGQVGSAPSTIRMSITSRIVPNDIM